MCTINVSVNDQVMTFTNMPVICSGDVNTDSISFEFDSSWNGYTKICVLYKQGKKGEYYFSPINSSGVATIPMGVMREKGRICFGVSGTSGNNQKTTGVLLYVIGEGAYVERSDCDYETFQEIKDQMLAVKESVTDINNNVFSNAQEIAHVGIKTKFIFNIMKMTHEKGWDSSTREKEYWESHGWLGKVRPWKK